jgi:3-methyl-2-oxobutanoate hydroxymethyltransferase
VVVDLPFMSYQVRVEEAIRNAGRVMAETGCQAVKLEGGRPMVPTVTALVERGIPVVGHLGLTPQHIQRFGGYRVQGRSGTDGDAMVADARALEVAGASAIVLELVPRELAARVTAAVAIPTIGIGAGPSCDGQVLVLHDMLGLNEGFAPRFLRHYAELGTVVRDAVAQYAEDVRQGTFPADQHSID